MEHYNTVIDHNMKKDLSKIFMMNLILYIGTKRRTNINTFTIYLSFYLLIIIYNAKQNRCKLCMNLAIQLNIENNMN